MSSSTERQTPISLTLPPQPRLRLQPDRSARTLLDGGWWPRSADPAAELPGLILALDERHGGPGMEISPVLVPGRRERSGDPARCRAAVRQAHGGDHVEVPAGHVAMVSHPDDVAQLIETAAEAVQTAH